MSATSGISSLPGNEKQRFDEVEDNLELSSSEPSSGDRDDDDISSWLESEEDANASQQEALRSVQRNEGLEDARLRRLRQSQQHYNGAYVELFSKTEEDIEGRQGDFSNHDAQVSRLGVVDWEPPEMGTFFNIVQRKGQIDTSTISSIIGSKSEAEVQHFLISLQNQNHLFWHDDYAAIPAAFEIDTRCEIHLDRAADALALAQDQYDQAVGGQKHPRCWIITQELAENFDKQIDHRDEDDESSNLEEPQVFAGEEVPAKGLFRLTSWLELSEKLFMNQGGPRLADNWQTLALEGETPAMTHEALSDFHALSLNLTRRLMQAAIFLANSRIRHTQARRKGRELGLLVKESDVNSAAKILGLDASLSDVLIGVPRRNHLLVVNNRHRETSRLQTFTYNQFEKLFSKREVGRRRRRSISRDSHYSFSSSDSDDNASSILWPLSRSTSAEVLSQGADAEFRSDKSQQGVNLVAESDTEDQSSSVEQTDTYLSSASTTRARKRRRFSQDIEDTRLEDLDRRNSKLESIRLWDILGGSSVTMASEEGERENPLIVPGKMTTSSGQSPFFSHQAPCAEWEAFGQSVSDREFSGSSSRHRSCRRQAQP